jgi:hypothetical protein
MKKPIVLLIIIISIFSCEKDESNLIVETYEVFNGTPPDSWTDLDLSDAVDKNYAYVTLKVLNQSTISGENNMFYFRQNGDTTYYRSGADQSLIVGVFPTDASLLNIYTDSQGLIEWKASDSFPTIVEVIAFIR